MTVVDWVALLLAFLLLSTWQLLLSRRTRPRNLPPGPRALPIIGHLHLLRQPLHHSLTELSRRHGPILYLRFGCRPVLVLSDPSAVEECYTSNDLVFANRPRMINTKYVHYDNTTLAAAPYGPHWQNLRRVTAVHLFSTSNISSFAAARNEDVRAMLQQLFREGEDVGSCFRKVQIRSHLKELVFDMIMRMISGKSCHGKIREDEAEGERLRLMGEEILRFTSVSTLEDFLPAFGWVSGVKKRLLGLRRRMDKMFQGMIDARRHPEAKQGKAKMGIIDILLRLQDVEGEPYTDEFIKGVIQVLVTGGTDSTSGAMEWAMALLLNHPEAMEKVRAEVDAVVGRDRLVESSDLPNLPYLHGVIKETLRLYPPGPLLLPHESSAECTVGGYCVPPGTMLLVNAYAIQRDPTLWRAPEEFRPERFAGGDVEGYKLIPFGAGRRGCPGKGHAMSLIALAVGSLVQCFEWERVGEEKVDMSEREGTAMPMARPLEALCRPRGNTCSVLSEP
ncbi:hypothetical protein Taro_050701 [Colocasia esculenta]|uniref:Uncharacterized protein n=1 Tax=Colocasia esculenta TaxID=4460 RepID=A0A843XER0_COLES|nr:hypothetical protein [Colocasia esculenta]